MNILFEGINGSGKTTLINQLKILLDSKKIKYNYISDLETNTPLSPVLEQMFSSSAFLETRNPFKTSLFESLVLAADHHFIQERYRDMSDLVLYDRDFISVLSYQKEIIRKDYPEDWDVFYAAFRTIMRYRLKSISLLCYISVPVEDNIKRTELRDGRKFSSDEKKMLLSLKKNMEREIEEYCNETKTALLKLDGHISPITNCQFILEKIKTL